MRTEIKRNIEYILKNILVKHKLDDFKVITFKKNEFIVKETDDISQISFIVSGKLKVSQEYENGKTLLLQFVDGLSIMGDVEYINELETATGTVQAVNEVHLINVSFAELRALYSNSKVFNDYMIKHLSRKLLNSNTKTGLNLMYPLITRLSSYLLSICDEDKDLQGHLVNMQDLSNNLGTSYRHLHRTMKELCDQGLIKRNKKSVTITNLKKMKELARGNIYEDSYNEIEE